MGICTESESHGWHSHTDMPLCYVYHLFNLLTLCGGGVIIRTSPLAATMTCCFSCCSWLVFMHSCSWGNWFCQIRLPCRTNTRLSFITLWSCCLVAFLSIYLGTRLIISLRATTWWFRRILLGMTPMHLSAPTFIHETHVSHTILSCDCEKMVQSPLMVGSCSVCGCTSLMMSLVTLCVLGVLLPLLRQVFYPTSFKQSDAGHLRHSRSTLGSTPPSLLCYSLPGQPTLSVDGSLFLAITLILF